MKLWNQLGINLDANTCREVAGVFVGKFVGVFFLSVISFVLLRAEFLLIFLKLKADERPC